MSLVPKSIEDSGRTLTLADVQWQEAGGSTTPPPPTGTASSKYATGYTVTADYAGEVTKTTSGTVLYTAVFGLAEEQEAVTAIPQPAAEGGGFDWRWLLVPPRRGGRCRPWYSWAASCFKKYKSKKEWKGATTNEAENPLSGCPSYWRPSASPASALGGHHGRPGRLPLCPAHQRYHRL